MAKHPPRSPWAKDPFRQVLKGYAFAGRITASVGVLCGLVVLWRDHSLVLVAGWLVCVFVALGRLPGWLRARHRKNDPSDDYLRARLERADKERQHNAKPDDE